MAHWVFAFSNYDAGVVGGWIANNLAAIDFAGGTAVHINAGAAALAGSLKALSDPARLRLLSLVAAHEDGEACVCDLTAPLGLSQPTVSHHLKVLVDAGFLTRSKRGTWAYYRLVPDSLDTVARLLATV